MLCSVKTITLTVFPNTSKQSMRSHSPHLASYLNPEFCGSTEGLLLSLEKPIAAEKLPAANSISISSYYGELGCDWFLHYLCIGRAPIHQSWPPSQGNLWLRSSHTVFHARKKIQILLGGWFPNFLEHKIPPYPQHIRSYKRISPKISLSAPTISYPLLLLTNAQYLWAPKTNPPPPYPNAKKCLWKCKDWWPPSTSISHISITPTSPRKTRLNKIRRCLSNIASQPIYPTKSWFSSISDHNGSSETKLFEPPPNLFP